MNRGGAEREGDTESEASSRLWAISPEPDAGLELVDREIVTWAEVRRPTNWATQAPLNLTFKNVIPYTKSPQSGLMVLVLGEEIEFASGELGTWYSKTL